MAIAALLDAGLTPAEVEALVKTNRTSSSASTPEAPQPGRQMPGL